MPLRRTASSRPGPRPPALGRWLAAAPALLALVLVGCAAKDYPQTTLSPHSEFAAWIQNLNVQLVTWAVVIFLAVQTMLIVAVVRFRGRPGAPDPKPVHGNTALEIAWTVAPALILTFVAVPTVMTIFRTQSAPARTDLVVKAVGHQWWWEFQYPALGFSTADEMHVPLGKTVTVEIESADVIHSFWFPAMGGKRDAIPGHTNRVWFTPSATGTYPGQCVEFCGTSHANMRMKLLVETPEAFAAWAANQQRPPVGGGAGPDTTAAPDSSAGPAQVAAQKAALQAALATSRDSLRALGALAQQGKQVFAQGACVGCHTVNGLSAGIIGPNLTHFASRTTFAGSIFENDAPSLGRWLADPPAQKPGSLMPKLGLTPAQIDALVAYLQSLK